MKLLTSFEVDRLLRYPRGRAMRLARQKRLPSIRLPDGQVRFDQCEIERLLASAAVPAEEGTVDHAR